MLKNVRIDRNTVVNSHRQTSELLKSYSSKYLPGFDFDDIDIRFYEKFKEFCFDIKSYSINNTGKHIKNIKAVMNSAYDDGVSTNVNYRKKAFKVLKEQASLALSHLI